MDAIDSSLDDVIMKDRQDKKQQKQKQTPRDGKRSQGINKRSGPIRNTSSGRGGAHRKSPTQGRRDTNSHGNMTYTNKLVTMVVAFREAITLLHQALFLALVALQVPTPSKLKTFTMK
ncbi:unnamed protein product [Umbelopsis ramanniana]